MAEITLHRGEKSKIDNLPLKDGQLIIGTISDKTAALYMDTTNSQGEVVRVVLDLTNVIERIVALEDKFGILEESVLTSTVIAPLITNDDINIITNNNENILLR